MKKPSQKSVLTTFENWKNTHATIGFRIGEDHGRVLFDRAAALKMSVHELARQYVIQMLHEADEREQLIQAVVALRDELLEARKDIAIATQEMLVSGGRATITEAKTWVKENLAAGD